MEKVHYIADSRMDDEHSLGNRKCGDRFEKEKILYIHIVVQHYESYIASLSMRKLRDERGNIYWGIDEDIRDLILCQEKAQIKCEAFKIKGSRYSNTLKYAILYAKFFESSDMKNTCFEPIFAVKI